MTIFISNESILSIVIILCYIVYCVTLHVTDYYPPLQVKIKPDLTLNVGVPFTLDFMN